MTGAEFAAIEDCLRLGMVQTEGELIAFRHELARQVVLEATSPAHRLVLHRLVLAALETSPDTKNDLARLTHHVEAAADHEAVARYARRRNDRPTLALPFYLAFLIGIALVVWLLAGCTSAAAPLTAAPARVIPWAEMVGSAGKTPELADETDQRLLATGDRERFAREQSGPARAPLPVPGSRFRGPGTGYFPALTFLLRTGMNQSEIDRTT